MKSSRRCLLRRARSPRRRERVNVGACSPQVSTAVRRRHVVRRLHHSHHDARREDQVSPPGEKMVPTVVVLDVCVYVCLFLCLPLFTFVSDPDGVRAGEVRRADGLREAAVQRVWDQRDLQGHRSDAHERFVQTCKL